jgi:lysophospholipase L1-like esterase
MKKKIIALIAVTLAVCIVAASCYVCNMFGVFKKGNYGETALENIELNQNSVLNGKTVIFLGSSVTEGFGSMGISFVDYLEKADGVIPVKEAVSGTTLADIGKKSYISRLKRINPDIKADAFVCQLSTNDATKNIPLGEVSAGFELDEFDTSTVAGAVEYIIFHVRLLWDCPVIFYTQAKYDSEQYAQMVELLGKIQRKWDITVIDLWSSEEFNAITQEQRSLYLVDKIHPTKAGYLEWWLPEFEKELSKVFE